MIKLCWVSTGLNTGGAEKMLVKVLKNIDRSKFSPVVVSLIDEGTLGNTIKEMGVPVFCLHMNTILGFFLAPFKLAYIFYKIKPDVIQGWMYHANLLAWVAKQFSARDARIYFGIRHTIYDYRLESKNTRLVIRLNAVLSKYTAGVLFNSYLSLDRHKMLGFLNKNLIVIPNGFELDDFFPDNDFRHKVRCDLQINDKKVVGLIARFDAAKDHYNFLQAASIVSQSISNVVFLLVGRGITLDNSILNQWITELKLEDKVLLLGERSDIPAINNALDVACLSSYMEAFPNVIGEAMACGIPCAATDVGDIRAIVGETGLVVSPRHHIELADAILSLLTLPPDTLDKMGVMARERIVCDYDIKKITVAYENCYLLHQGL